MVNNVYPCDPRAFGQICFGNGPAVDAGIAVFAPCINTYDPPSYSRACGRTVFASNAVRPYVVIKNSRWFSAWMSRVYIYDLCGYEGLCFVTALRFVIKNSRRPSVCGKLVASL